MISLHILISQHLILGLNSFHLPLNIIIVAIKYGATVATKYAIDSINKFCESFVPLYKVMNITIIKLVVNVKKLGIAVFSCALKIDTTNFKIICNTIPNNDRKTVFFMHSFEIIVAEISKNEFQFIILITIQKANNIIMQKNEIEQYADDTIFFNCE